MLQRKKDSKIREEEQEVRNKDKMCGRYAKKENTEQIERSRASSLMIAAARLSEAKVQVTWITAWTAASIES